MQSIVGITIGRKKCLRNCIWFKNEILTQENVLLQYVFGTAEPVAGRLCSHVIRDGSWLWLLQTQMSWTYSRGYGASCAIWDHGSKSIF